MDLLDLYFKSNRYFVTNHHIESYNEFVNSTITNVVQSMNPFKVIKNDVNNALKYEILIHIGGKNSDQLFFTRCTTKDVHVQGGERLMYPNECRMTNKSYVSELRAHIEIEFIDHQAGKTIEKTLKNVFLCFVPIMVHSNICMLNHQPTSILKAAGECPYDQGGYFIIDGKEKVIVAQERNVTNRIYIKNLPINVTATDDDSTEAFIRCTSEKNSVFPKTVWMYINRKKGSIYVQVPHIDLDVPVFLLFRALGIESDRDIINMIHPDLADFLRPSIIQANHTYSQMGALKWLSWGTDFKNVENVMYILFEDFFPNVPNTLLEKAKFLGLLVRQMCQVNMGVRQEGNRDNYMEKRVGISGFLLGDIFKDFYNQFRVDTRTRVDKKYELGSNTNTLEELSHMINELNLHDFFSKCESFQVGLIKSLKGNWGLSYDSELQGIVQDLNRISYVGFISHMRRVSCPIKETALKLRPPHQLGTSQWGYMCPCESPDGASIGLMKNMALLCHITSGVSPAIVLNALASVNLTIIPTKVSNHIDVRLHVNNNWIGTVKEPEKVVDCIRVLRRNGYIDKMISVSWNVLDNSINILTDSGRCCRPLLLCEKMQDYFDIQGIKTWADLFKTHKKLPVGDWDDIAPALRETVSIIDYVDVEESNVSLIAMDKTQVTKYHTHCEIHPSTIMSVYTSTIPLANHNQAPRNIFSGAQGKQAIGVYATNYNNRVDTLSLILHYPQRSLVSTRCMDYLHVNKLPNGENLIVAIMTYTGYNQEDSIILNRDSVQRGMFNVTYYSTHVSSEMVSEHDNLKIESKFANPNHINETEPNANVKITRFGNYTKIDKQGMPILNERIIEGDCIVGKVQKMIEEESIGNADTDMFVNKVAKTAYKSVCDIADKTTSGFVNKVVMYEDVTAEGVPVNGVKIQLRDTREPEYGDKMACYSDDTEVLTDRGWVFWRDLSRSKHKVASLNAKFEVVYMTPSNIFKYDHTGDMICASSTTVSLCVTQNHNLLVQRGADQSWILQRADTCEVASFLRGNTPIGNAELPGISDQELVEFAAVASNLSSFDDHACQFVWDLSARQAKLLLDAIMDGNKMIASHNADLQRLALHAGSAAFYYAENIGIITPIVNNITFEKKPYSGNVWCCECNGLVYVRRNGKPLWCGNSRHGQKGVIGSMIPSTMMPFTKDGLVPDMIINPHAIPTRMTIGHLIECLMAKAGAVAGFYADGTAFENQDVEKTACAVLEKHGYERNGDELMYNGITGEQMDCQIFIGPTYYFRLKHMVADKINFRADGPVVGLTQQPTKGRSGNGGLRIGEMETNVLIAHGISSFAKESMMERSDKCAVPINSSGVLGIPSNHKKKVGKLSDKIVEIPFAFKLLTQELMTMNVVPLFKVNDDDDASSNASNGQEIDDASSSSSINSSSNNSDEE